MQIKTPLLKIIILTGILANDDWLTEIVVEERKKEIWSGLNMIDRWPLSNCFCNDQ